MKVLLDTSAIVGITTSEIRFEAIERRLEKYPETYYCMSILSFYEIHKNLEAETFTRFKEIICRILKTCCLYLIDPHVYLRSFYERSSKWVPYSIIIKSFLQRVVSFNSYEHYLDYFGEEEISMFLSEYRSWETQFIYNMCKRIPDKVFFEYEQSHPPRVGEKRMNAREYFNSTEFVSAFRKDLFEIVFDKILDTNSKREMQMLESLNSYISAWGNKLSKVYVNKDYNIEKHRNDFVDINFLLYLCDPQLVWVTKDTKIVTTVQPKNERIITV